MFSTFCGIGTQALYTPTCIRTESGLQLLKCIADKLQPIWEHIELEHVNPVFQNKEKMMSLMSPPENLTPVE